MISYKWIEECVKQGEQVDRESYKIRRPSHVRAHSTHRSLRRNEYSVEDDRILIEHVKKHAARGASISGNKIFDSFAAEVRV